MTSVIKPVREMIDQVDKLDHALRERNEPVDVRSGHELRSRYLNQIATYFLGQATLSDRIAAKQEQ